MNALKGEAPLVLKDGRSFTLVLGFAAYAAAERQYRKPFPEIMVEAQAGYMGAQAALLLGALQVHHPGELSAEEAGEMLISETDAVIAAISEAMELATPKADGRESGDRETGKARRAGTSSGASGAKPVSTRTASGGKPRARSK